VRRILLKGVQSFLRWRPHDVVNFVDLVKLVVAGEEREEGKYFEKDTAYTPDVHLVPVVTVSQETLRCAIPPSGYVLGEGRFAVKASATTQIC
jgi:hypothetical protein